MKRVLVCGAGGFIGSHLVKYLKAMGYYVRASDIRKPAYSQSKADDFKPGDLREISFVQELIDEPFDEVYQMAADMGGAGYMFTGEKDADIMYNASLINLNVLKQCVASGVKKIFYPSSACVYPESDDLNPESGNYNELDAYPAYPGSEYGWEKLFSERLYHSFMRNYGIIVKIARFHTIFGPEMLYEGGKEKVPAALARKVLMAEDQSEIEIWGDGKQTRSFLYIDECLEGIQRLMKNDDFHGPVNLGSDKEISINELAKTYIEFSGKNLRLKYIKGPQGTRSRNSDNSLILEKLDWKPSKPIRDGLKEFYDWIETQLAH